METVALEYNENDRTEAVQVFSVMGLFPKTYPPVASDIPRGEVIASWRSSRPVDDCLRDIGDYLGVHYLYPVNSGRTALYLILRATLAPGSKVVIPGYTCFTVPAAVIRAGMTPIISDSDPSDLGYDPQALATTVRKHPDISAIVACHLFGIAVDIDAIREAVGPEVLIIDDAAQAMGIRINDRYLGTFGNAGFYSFGRGKNLSLMGGGMLVLNDESIAKRIESVLNDHFGGNTARTGLIKMLLYNTATRPSAYSVLSRLPGVGLGKNDFMPRFETAVMSPTKIRLLARLISSSDELNARRRQVGQIYATKLGDVTGVSIPRSKIDGRTGSLRFPVLVDDPVRRTRILEQARKRGLGLSAMYPTALNALPELRESAASDLSGARRIANAIVTLPTHRHIPVDEGRHDVVDEIVGLFR